MSSICKLDLRLVKMGSSPHRSWSWRCCPTGVRRVLGASRLRF